jgi:nitrite reductase/ring-hydroxylating ferredoxin subunit
MKLLLLADLPDPGARGLVIDGLDVVVVRLGDEVRGYLNACPHRGVRLSPWPERHLTKKGDRLICFGHGALFRPQDGLCTAGPCEGDRLEAWPVAVEDGWIVTA